MNELATVEAPADLKAHVAECVAWSENNVIVTEDDYVATARHRQENKARIKQAEFLFDPPAKQAHDLHKMLVGRKQMVTAPSLKSLGIDDTKMLAHQEEKRQKADAERRRLQAIVDESARKEREKIEQEAAKQRAIEEAAKVKAEQARREAEEATAAVRRKLLAQAATAERAAAAAAVKQEIAAEAVAAIQAPVIHVDSAMPKAAGVIVRKTWEHEIVDPAAFFAYVCEAKRQDLVLPNEKVLAAYAKAMRDGAAIPGVRFFEKATMASRGQ